MSLCQNARLWPIGGGRSIAVPERYSEASEGIRGSN